MLQNTPYVLARSFLVIINGCCIKVYTSYVHIHEIWLPHCSMMWRNEENLFQSSFLTGVYRIYTDERVNDRDSV
jgi:hypothetical protein